MSRESRRAAASLTPHFDEIEKLKESAEQIGLAWSKGWVGYHSRVYKADLRPVRPGEYWDEDFAWDPLAETRGEWREFDHEQIVTAIRKRVGMADSEKMAEIDRIAKKVGETFDQLRNEAVATLAAIGQSSEFLTRSRNTVEKISRNYTAHEIVQQLVPKEVRTPLDRRARHEGFAVPPHLHIVALCFQRISFVEGCRQLATELDNIVTYLDASTRVDRTSQTSLNEEMANMAQDNATRVFIIHGRNMAPLEELRAWCDSLGLHAKGFDDLRAEMGGSPTMLEVIQKGMTEARAIIALMTPDEKAFLRPAFQRENDTQNDKERWQARPNVLFEAGMAFALAGNKRTLLLVAGAELFSDVAGINYLTIPHDAASRERLKTALRTMGCDVRDDSQHHNRGHFSVTELDRLKTRSPFEGIDKDD